ncbi:MAG: UDP-3-O-acyl-N-acetylglucosamine deacetylase [Alphaproteobacteria bacterium]|nr:UDP-3-O-acyl-N-acetylglucosamine deacetylase [Alphaproteobacteria bacterium]
MQQTLRTFVTVEGTGLHSGALIAMTLRPAPAGHGIVFLRTDVTDRDNRVPALWNRVVDTRLCTVVGNEAGVSVGTVEHLMAALRGCGVDNLLIEIDGPEVPVMDGSSLPFVRLIEQAGVIAQAAPRRVIRILETVVVEQDGKRASLSPSEVGLFGGEIVFDHPQIGAQSYSTPLVNGNFIHELASARTFGFLHEVEYLQAQGLALGGSLDNAIVLDAERVVNPDGLRHPDEFIRHKLLDAVGDLYLAGAPILGAYEGSRAGHALNNALLHALFAAPQAWEYVLIGNASGDAFLPVPGVAEIPDALPA